MDDDLEAKEAAWVAAADALDWAKAESDRAQDEADRAQAALNTARKSHGDAYQKLVRAFIDSIRPPRADSTD
jgi:hypothetical protein